MGKWEEENLSNLFEIKSSKRVLKSDWKTEGVPFYRAREVVKLAQNGFVNNELFISEKLYDQYTKDRGFPKEDDIIISAVGTLGQCYLVKKSDKFYFKDASVLWFEKKSDTDSRFIEYAFKTRLIKNQINKKSSGATVGTLTISTARNLKIPLPPLAEQQRIVAKLDGLFAKIDKAIGLLEDNIAHTQALMGSVLDEEFGRLEKYNKPLMTFCKNPKKDMVGGPFGSNLKASEYVDKGYPIIRLQNVDRFNFKEKNIMFVTEEKAEFLSSHSYISGDIVMTKLGDPLGKCCVVEDVHGVDRGVISSDIIRIRIDESKHYKPYVVAGINSEFFIKQLKSKTQGSTRPRVTLKEVRAMQLPMLKREDQVIAAKRIDGILELQSKVLETQNQKLNHLKALKSSLLDQAFKGDL
ncbi:restriction modification system DNA specificity domain protein [Cellulophaga lytica DSM 7489]|uniref:Restriction modification system DNA specificity domain protein n=1 Tax=Cellulophaga lytica (strain ATCC 23178 / DSM 7489 / JCM 8516 / NBRC 14961 / NCIMB 1423 / VKM B-1433 / Cy l20) TaxID=867900 RepID=F0RDC8_CELLC|nr:restriction endonuclease subunit S [Cellulophaga lytica]ADY30870.1 restriction modification system DNA specificity domain protein [Cellulophaga lytica DSM 7489]WQG78211.1 restriction endonuclease subunit S [Cellulophaga lytica]